MRDIHKIVLGVEAVEALQRYARAIDPDKRYDLKLEFADAVFEYLGVPEGPAFCCRTCGGTELTALSDSDFHTGIPNGGEDNGTYCLDCEDRVETCELDKWIPAVGHREFIPHPDGGEVTLTTAHYGRGEYTNHRKWTVYDGAIRLGWIEWIPEDRRWRVAGYPNVSLATHEYTLMGALSWLYLNPCKMKV